MPKGERLDVHEEFHPVIVRGIERTAIYLNGTDQLNFVNQIGKGYQMEK